jgi:hypothetical protein
MVAINGNEVYWDGKRMMERRLIQTESASY